MFKAFAQYKARREQKRLEREYMKHEPLNKMVNSVANHPVVIMIGLCAWLGALMLLGGIGYGFIKLVQVLIR